MDSIAGLLDATDGEISVLGQDMQGLSGTDSVLFRRKNLGFVYQFHHLLPEFSARENVVIPQLVRGTHGGSRGQTAG